MFFRIATAELYCMSGSFYFYLKENSASISRVLFHPYRWHLSFI